jgi:hypothetical protein
MPEERDLSRFVWDIDDIVFEDEPKKKKDDSDEEESVNESVLVDGLRYYQSPEMREKWTLVKVRNVHQEIPEETGDNSFIVDEKNGIHSVKVKNDSGNLVVAAIMFDKDKFGEDQDKIFKWIREHGFMVFKERFDSLYTLPPLIRNMFNHRLDLINEWREYYMEALSTGKPMPRVWAWYRFKNEYGKSSTGRWIRKDEK